MVNYNNNLYFIANDGVHGFELFTYDKESNTTRLIEDIRVGIASSFCGNYSYYHSDIVTYNNKLYFSADNGISGCELYSYNSVTDEINLVADLKGNGTGVDGRYYSHYASSYPRDFTVHNNKLYFIGSIMPYDPYYGPYGPLSDESQLYVYDSQQLSV